MVNERDFRYVLEALESKLLGLYSICHVPAL
jgi:hypothetical protein